MDVTDYFNNRIKWEKQTGVDENNNASYNPSKYIQVRIEGGGRFIRKPDGTDTTSEKGYWSLEKVLVGDILNGQYVISSKEIYDFDGSYIYTESYV